MSMAMGTSLGSRPSKVLREYLAPVGPRGQSGLLGRPVVGSVEEHLPPWRRVHQAVAAGPVVDQDASPERVSPDPHAAAVDFLRSAFHHAYRKAGWSVELGATAEGRPPPVR